MTDTPPAAGRAERIASLGYDYDAKPKRRIEQCELCGSTGFTVLNARDRYGYRAPATSCRTCGLTQLNPVMTTEAYGEFYAHVYRPLVSAFHGRLIDAETIQDEQRDYAAALGDLMEPELLRRRPRTLLDIGGSTGVVGMALASRFDLQPTILDPAADELDWAKKAGVEAISGFVEEYDPGDRRFDLIILCQTVDHLSNLTASIEKISQLLSPGGLFFVDIVDFRAAYLRARGPSGAIKIDHPYYLTEVTIEVVLRNAGFDVITKNFAADGLHIGYVCELGAPREKTLPDPEAVRRYFEELRFVQNLRP